MNWEMEGEEDGLCSFLNACKCVVPNKYFKTHMGLKKKNGMSIKIVVGSGPVHVHYQGHSPPPWPVQMWYEMVRYPVSMSLLQFSIYLFLGAVNLNFSSLYSYLCIIN